MIPIGSARNIAMLFAAAVLASAAAFAQQPGAEGPPAPGVSAQPMPGPGSAPAADANSDQLNLQKMNDQDFIRNTLKNDQAQIRLSRLAEQKASSPDVKQLSEQMVKVHTELNHQLDPVAKQLGVSEPTPSKKEKKEIAKIQGLSGQSFEIAYLQAMAHEQQESLKRFHDEAKDSANPGLERAAREDAPVLTQSFQLLQKVAQAHNVEIAGKGKQ